MFPIIRALPTTPADCRFKRSVSSTPRLTVSINSTERTFAFSKELNPTFSPMDRWTIQMRCWRQFDFVIASVHGRFALDREAQTARILRAVENPYTTILGHMTGRQLLRRPGYEVDVERILAACAAQGVAVEINANPWRLDLDWRWHQRALELGCMMSINPDAHSTDEIDLTHWGVEMARKGGVPRSAVLNCLDLPAFARHLTKRVRHRQRRTVAAFADLKPLESVGGERRCAKTVTRSATTGKDEE